MSDYYGNEKDARTIVIITALCGFLAPLGLWKLIELLVALIGHISWN